MDSCLAPAPAPADVPPALTPPGPQRAVQNLRGRPQLRAARAGEGGGGHGGGGDDGDEDALEDFLDDCEARYVRQPSDDAAQLEADAAYEEFLQMTAAASVRH